MILFFILPLLAVPVLSSMNQIRCDPPSMFSVDLSGGKEGNIYGAEISVIFPREKVRLHSYPDSKAVKITVNDTLMILRGYLTTSNSSTLGKIDQTFNLQVKGLGKLNKSSLDTKLDNCLLHLIMMKNDSSDILPEVQSKFIQHGDTCINSQLCSKIGSILPEDYESSNKSYTIGLDSKPSREDLNSQVSELQASVNNIVDFALKELLIRLKEKNEDKVKIPDIDETFTTGKSIFKTTGRLETKDGQFSDLTTLKRTNNASLHRDELKFTASCGFGLSKALTEYDHYKLKYGLIKINGKMSAKIDGIAIDAKISVDYNQYPCKTTLEELKISEFGKMKIKVTGFGPLNSLASSIMTWITTKWQAAIAKSIETRIKEVLNHQLEAFDCEKYA